MPRFSTTLAYLSPFSRCLLARPVLGTNRHPLTLQSCSPFRGVQLAQGPELARGSGRLCTHYCPTPGCNHDAVPPARVRLSPLRATGPEAGGWESPGLAAWVQAQALLRLPGLARPTQLPHPSPQGRPSWVSSAGVPRLPPPSPSLPPGQYCSQRKCPV